MYTNLRAEMVRNKIDISDIQNLLGLSEKTVRLRLMCRPGFTYQEAETLRDKYFHGVKLEYLFNRDEQEN